MFAFNNYEQLLRNTTTDRSNRIWQPIEVRKLVIETKQDSVPNLCRCLDWKANIYCEFTYLQTREVNNELIDLLTKK